METSKTGKEASRKHAETQNGMPRKLAAWRQKLSDKAKQEKSFKFYSLFDLVCHPDTLRWAWTLMRRNNGAPGVDGVTFKKIEQSKGGVERFLQELEEKLKSKTYKAKPVRRVYIEKPNGKSRRFWQIYTCIGLKSYLTERSSAMEFEQNWYAMRMIL